MEVFIHCQAIWVVLCEYKGCRVFSDIVSDTLQGNVVAHFVQKVRFEKRDKKLARETMNLLTGANSSNNTKSN